MSDEDKMPGFPARRVLRFRRSGWCRRAGCDRGAAAVEMALVLPVLLLVVFGIIDFGRMLNAQLTLTEAAREGARAVAVGQSPNSRVTSVAGNLSGGVNPPVVVNGCPGGDVKVTVTYNFQFVTPVSAFASMFGSGTGNTVPLKGTGVMVCSS